MAAGDKNNDEIRDRLDKLEVLAILAFLGSRDDIDDENLYFLRHYLVDKDGQGRSKHRPTLNDMLEYLMFRERPRIATLREKISSIQGNQQELTEQVTKEISELTRRLDKTAASLDLAERSLKKFRADTHAWLSLQNLGLDSSELRLPRIIPLRVYLSDEGRHTVDGVSRAIQDVVKEFGLELADEFPAIRGSWFKKWFVQTADAMTQPEVADRIKKIERALELKGLAQPQAEIDEKQASAAAKLMEALKDTPNAAIQVGSILLIKRLTDTGSTVQIRTLTPAELMHLENNQALLMSPENVLQRLSNACRSGDQRHELDSLSHENGYLRGDGDSREKGDSELPQGFASLQHDSKLLGHTPDSKQDKRV